MREKQRKDNVKRRTNIGGQALIEGIMMRGTEQSAMAVRLPDGTIDLEIWPNKQPKIKKIPLLRGVYNFVDSLIQGYKTLMKSAEKAGIEEDEEPSKFDRWVTEKLGDAVYKVIGVIATVLAAVLAVGLFTYLPSLVIKLLDGVIPQGLMTVCEGLIRIVIFVLYVYLTSLMKEIRRVYAYHGAEHKTIACYEAGEPLTVENIRGKRRFHPRCGTSLLLNILILSILLFSLPFMTWDNLLLRMGLKLLLLPVLVSISYELARFMGRHDNLFVRIMTAPGLWLQRITTREPDGEIIEVAIAAMNAVLPPEDEGSAAN